MACCDQAMSSWVSLTFKSISDITITLICFSHTYAEVNGQRLLGMNHLDVVSILKELPQDVRMVCARSDVEMVPFTEENVRKNLDLEFPGNQNISDLVPNSDRLVKAKSDGSLATSGTGGDDSFTKLKSRSLEPLTGLAMWSSEPQIIELVKGERGLGFSILDYQVNSRKIYSCTYVQRANAFPFPR